MIVVRRPIQVLPRDLTLLIAAGEVAERPAAVVKELIDNAIDAGATTVRIEIREAGLKLIRVTDNGCGIPRNELGLAFTSHATSKIDRPGDLGCLRTLGFRGEALPSIAAVSRVDVLTRATEEETGTRFEIEHGVVRAQMPAGAPPGTRMAIADLFSNVPARRAFVRSLRAEGSQISTVVHHYALAQPAVQFSLIIDERRVFQGPGTNRLREAMAAVYGPTMLESLVDVDDQEGDVFVAGLTCKPSLSRQNRSGITIAVNGRPIQNRSLGFALAEAYSGYLMTGRYPVAAIHLQLDPSLVDVNIHPAKSEVRFANEREVHGALHRAIGRALLQSFATPSAVEIDQTDESVFVLNNGAGQPAPLFNSNTWNQPLVPDVPVLRVFGQSNQTFIIAEGPDGIFMIDQHAAHERVLYDKFDQEMADGPAVSQALLEPLSVELTADQILALDENRDLLGLAGFVLEPFGDGACLIRAVPALARSGDAASMVQEVLNELKHLPRPEAARDRALAAVSCQAAMKAGQSLDLREMRELVSQLEHTLRPATCPHGRPTMIHLSHSQLEKQFGRR
jgi:DNA mismatch repair protein MutL